MKKIYKSTIDKLSKKLKINLDYIVKSGFWLALSKFSGISKSFILSLIFANVLSKNIYGEYAFIISILAIANIFSLPGMEVAVISAVAKGYDYTYIEALKKIFKYSFLGSAFLFLFAIYEYYLHNIILFFSFLFLSLIFPILSSVSFYPSFLIGKKRFDLLSNFSLIFNIISTLAIGITSYLTKNPFFIIVSNVLCQIVFQGFFTFEIIKKYIKSKHLDKESINFGKSISKSIAFSNIANNIDSLIIVNFLGFKELAIYKVVTLVPNQIKNFANILHPIILPKFSEKNVKKEDVIRYTRKLLPLVVFLIMIYIPLAPIVFKLFYPKYYDYVWLSVLFHLSFIVFLNVIFYNYLIKEGKEKIINRLNFFSSCFLIVLSIFFTYFLGLLGIIFSRIMYRLFVLFYLAYNSFK